MRIEKIIKIILVILILFNLKIILKILEPIYCWLLTTLHEVTYWDKTVQVCLAFIVIGITIFIVLKLLK